MVRDPDGREVLRGDVQDVLEIADERVRRKLLDTARSARRVVAEIHRFERNGRSLRSAEHLSPSQVAWLE